MAIVERPYTTLYWSLFAVFSLFGISMTIIGSSLPKILADFHWNYSIAGMVIAAASVGYFIATFSAGNILARLGFRKTLSIGFLLIIGSLFLFGLHATPALNIFLYFLCGIGQGFLEVAVNAAVMRMDTSGQGRAMSLLHGAFALGAVIGPLAMSIILSLNIAWLLMFRITAILYLLLALVLQMLPFRVLGETDRSSRASGAGGTLYRQPAAWLGFLALMCYVGAEHNFSNWISEYAVSVFGAMPATGSLLVSLFWLGLMAGRMGVPLVARQMRLTTQLQRFALLMAGSFVLVFSLGWLGRGALPLVALLSFVAGFGCSILYPTVMTMLGGAFREQQGPIIGFAATGGGVGGFVFPLLLAQIGALAGIRAAFAANALIALGMQAIDLALVHRLRRMPSMKF